MLLPALNSTSVSIDVHVLKIQGGGQLRFFTKFLGEREVKAFQTKLPRGVPYLGFYFIFINKSFKIFLGGSYVSIPPSPLTPLCASMSVSQPFSLPRTLLMKKFSCGTRKHQQKCVVESQAVYLTSFACFIALVKISQNP